MVEIRHYHPSDIFVNNSSPVPMTGPANIDLAESFVHSRFDERYEYNPQLDGYEFIVKYKYGPEQNAGAVAPYHRNGINKYIMSVYLKNKEYNAISVRIGRTTYGHTEIKLIMDLLDDLISTNPNDKFRVPRPKSIQWRDGQQAALEYLTDNAAMYTRYLEEKGIIVKMCSERPPCNYTYKGGPCEDFLRNICPKGSQIVYIVENHHMLEAEVQAAFTDLKNAYQQFLTSEQDKTRRINQCFI
ncbi:hypothetical protein TKK_0000091 [Trichogramma kaykai]|uniref:Helitron helicase-like domain-containing protein n=1 Tax=Trichogramma kaykai TaxID=54128 RepID=A0ABD2VT34_9HYME